MLTDEQLTEWQRLADEAKPFVPSSRAEPNTDFIWACRTAVPTLIAEVRRLTVKLGAASTQYHVMRESYEPLCQERDEAVAAREKAEREAADAREYALTKDRIANELLERLQDALDKKATP
jgi:hypothetical protein